MKNKQRMFQLNLSMQRKVDGSHTNRISWQPKSASPWMFTEESDSFDFLGKNWNWRTITLNRFEGFFSKDGIHNVNFTLSSWRWILIQKSAISWNEIRNGFTWNSHFCYKHNSHFDVMDANEICDSTRIKITIRNSRMRAVESVTIPFNNECQVFISFGWAFHCNIRSDFFALKCSEFVFCAALLLENIHSKMLVSIHWMAFNIKHRIFNMQYSNVSMV